LWYNGNGNFKQIRTLQQKLGCRRWIGWGTRIALIWQTILETVPAAMSAATAEVSAVSVFHIIGAGRSFRGVCFRLRWSVHMIAHWRDLYRPMEIS